MKSPLFRLNLAQLQKAVEILFTAAILPTLINCIPLIKDGITWIDVETIMHLCLTSSGTYIIVTYLRDENGKLIVWRIVPLIKKLFTKSNQNTLTNV